MSTIPTLEQVEELAIQLPPLEQVKLVRRLSERLSDAVEPASAFSITEEVAAILAELEAAALPSKDKPDSVQTIHRIREERHSQWQNES